jgi:hypothetical protein
LSRNISPHKEICMSQSTGTHVPQLSVIDSLNNAPISFFSPALRAAFTAGMGFFADAYDLFIIGSALVFIKPKWHLSDTQIAFLGRISLIAAFFGNLYFDAWPKW